MSSLVGMEDVVDRVAINIVLAIEDSLIGMPYTFSFLSRKTFNRSRIVCIKSLIWVAFMYCMTRLKGFILVVKLHCQSMATESSGNGRIFITPGIANCSYRTSVSRELRS